MNRETMRGLLRRRLNDEAEVDWTNAQLNEALNEAAAFVQSAISIVEPEAFLRVTRQHVRAGEDLYRKPAGIWSLKKLKLKQAAPLTGYKSLGTPVDDDALESIQLSGTSSTPTRFGHFGEFVKIAPIPTADVTDGLEWIWVYGAQMAEDDDVLAIHIGLHNAVVLRAEILLALETASANTKELRTQLEEELGRVPHFYRRSVGPELPLQPAVTKGY